MKFDTAQDENETPLTCLTIASNAATPISLVYLEVAHFRVRPDLPGYTWSTRFQKNRITNACLVRAPSTESQLPTFFFAVRTQQKENGEKISLDAPLSIQNLCATSMEYRLWDGKSQQLLLNSSFDKGIKHRIHSIDCRPALPVLLSVRLPGYDTWSSPLAVNAANSNSRDSLKVQDARGYQLTLQVKTKLSQEGHRRVFIFSPYWFINKTGLRVLFKEQLSSHLCASRLATGDFTLGSATTPPSPSSSTV